MKRDWDVIRDVLMEVEGLTETQRHSFEFDLSAAANDTERSRVEHALLLWRSDYIDAVDATTLSGAAIIGPSLTWQGHDLLDTIRSKPVWERIKATAKAKGLELTLDGVKLLAKVALDQIVKNGG